MSEDEYVRAVLSKYVVQTGPYSPAEQAGRTLIPTIQHWAYPHLIGCEFSGSYAKGTGIAGTTDIDLFISVSENSPQTLKQLYESLLTHQSLAYYQPRAQNVSIGLTVQGVKVDLVPAKRQAGYIHYHSLYERKRSSWTQTNIQQHIKVVKDSGRTAEIRALKIWRKLNNLDLPSFYLELTMLDALKWRSTGTLAANVLHALTYLRDSFVGARVVDPSNTNNVVSDDLSQSEKLAISYAAGNTLRQPNWASIIW